MLDDSALEAFAALSQRTRLDICRTLVAAGEDGLSVYEIAERIAAPRTTLSSHLGVLARARLVTAERRSRIIVYRANTELMRRLGAFLDAGLVAEA